MNQKTQLQFNLGSLPHSSNLATNFDPMNQPPIIINKLGAVQTVGFSQTPREAFQVVSPDRLALAVKLARRNIQRSRVSCSGDLPSCSTSDHEDVTHHTRAPQPPKTAKEEPAHHHKQASCMKIKSPTVDCVRAPKTAAANSVANEISRLKVELQEQLVRLSTTNQRMVAGEQGRVPGGGRRRNAPASRRWGEEGEENEERHQRRRKEQWSRNARMIYDLSQQVKDLEKKTCQKQQHYQESSEQTEVVKKLAAAQRAALRTLQSFSGKGGGSQESIPPELSLLVQQLALMSTQLGGGGGGGSLDITAGVHQLMKTIEERQTMAKLAHEQSVESHFVQHTRTNIPKRNRSNTRKRKNGLTKHALVSHTGLLLGPQLQQRRGRSHGQTRNTHFTQGTFSSVGRQQPPVVYMTPHSSPAQAVLSTPMHQSNEFVLACSPMPLHSHKEEAKNKKKKTAMKNSLAFRKKAKPSLQPAKVRKKQQLWHEEMQERALECNEEEDVDKNDEDLPSQPSVLLDNLSSAFAQQANQLECIRQEISHNLMELKAGVMGGQRTYLPHSAPVMGGQRTDFPHTAPVMRGQRTNLPHTAPVMGGQRTDLLCAAPSVAQKHSSNLPNTKVSGMLMRLDELEAEEDKIRQRWTSIVYEDLVSKPGSILHNKRKQKNQLPSLQKPVALPHLSIQSKEDLEDYRRRYMHYLDCTGLSTQGGFNPWEMAEKIADELLCELLEGVAEEVEQVCDGCIEGLYGAEFLRPP